MKEDYNHKKDILHHLCIQYQYDVLYFKYGKEYADKVMQPKRQGHLTPRQSFRVYNLKGPISCSYEEAKGRLSEYSTQLHNHKKGV